MSDTENDQIEIDASLQVFLVAVASGQSLALASWAVQILRRETITMQELERCFVLGFE